MEGKVSLQKMCMFRFFTASCALIKVTNGAHKLNILNRGLIKTTGSIKGHLKINGVINNVAALLNFDHVCSQP